MAGTQRKIFKSRGGGKNCDKSWWQKAATCCATRLQLRIEVTSGKVGPPLVASGSFCWVSLLGRTLFVRIRLLDRDLFDGPPLLGRVMSFGSHLLG